MKKALAIAVCLMFIATAAVAIAGPGGNSNIGHLYLYEKDPATWEIVDDGAWGKMKYNLAGPEFNFVFNGHGLEPNTEYTLIYYKDPWETQIVTCLAAGTSNGGGNINLANSIELNKDLVDSGVPDDGTDGAKIWLVLSSDVNCEVGYMAAWNPTEYLFEGNGIFYDDTDVL